MEDKFKSCYFISRFGYCVLNFFSLALRQTVKTEFRVLSHTSSFSNCLDVEFMTKLMPITSKDRSMNELVIRVRPSHSATSAVDYGDLCAMLCLVRSNSLWPPWTVIHQDPLSMGIFQARILEWLPCPPPGDLPNSGIKPRSPTRQADFLLSELPGKPNNTEVGSLSLLHEIFLTQESNWRLLHCRQILYRLSYPGSPMEIHTALLQ